MNYTIHRYGRNGKTWIVVHSIRMISEAFFVSSATLMLFDFLLLELEIPAVWRPDWLLYSFWQYIHTPMHIQTYQTMCRVHIYVNPDVGPWWFTGFLGSDRNTDGLYSMNKYRYNRSMVKTSSSFSFSPSLLFVFFPSLVVSSPSDIATHSCWRKL